ncbi:hypothetical protein J2Z69_002062 [Paenibacillus shirakamiensis]|uniref:Uncharacterized protein n=1 Tax=Paenibacillus shirakamiensis TaxID=1265935 RepID=A0ABS4JH21_9BACL|nr:hypothetical protein [Paenibacillus shirakamiensis]MBP2001019.1 hypothetical protein [Paenibacillus shirakamiensis]
MKTVKGMDSEQAKELFSYFGLAVYYSQALEHQLANLIMLMKLSSGKVPSDEDFSELFQAKLSSSLGQLIKEIQHHFAFSEEETNQLTRIWKQRNYIVHDYFKERIHDTFSRSGRQTMIKELLQFKDEAQALERKLQHYASELYEQVGAAMEDS